MTVLDEVKKAVRIRNTTAYDSELELYIKAVKTDCIRLGLVVDDLDPDYVTACCTYAKANFGNASPADKETWENIYERMISKMRMNALRRGD